MTYADTWLEHELRRVLPAFLPRQRWFASKAREIQEVDVEDAVWLAPSLNGVAFLIAAVRYVDGTNERYAMLIGIAGHPTDLPIVAPMEGLGSTVWAVEAMGETSAVRALLGGFVSGHAIPMHHGGRLIYGDTTTSAGGLFSCAAEHMVAERIGGEQSNTSVRVAGQLVLKLFRKLETGENPEREVGRFLTNETAFRAMPALHGSLTYVSATGESSTVGVLQDWIESLSDGWAHVIALLRQVRSGTSVQVLASDMCSLGAVTADLHRALSTRSADLAFASEPVTAGDIHAWKASVLNRVARTTDLLARRIGELDLEARQLSETLLGLQQRMVDAAVSELSVRGGFHKIRIHGDYHLGQVLKTRSGFVVIDFEGEPGRPLEERRHKNAALKDVAGMMRSFDYAIGAAPTDDGDLQDEMLAQRLRQSFLDGYLTSASASDVRFVPGEREAIEGWIDFFEFEKALYEVEYEVNNRPSWARIPLRGVLRMLRRKA